MPISSTTYDRWSISMVALAAQYTSAAPDEMSACASPISGWAKATDDTFEAHMTGAPFIIARYPF